jgi:chromosome segregation ATPase
MHEASASMPATSNGSDSGGQSSSDLDRLFADLQRSHRQLQREREELWQAVSRLEKERDDLRQVVATLEEKCRNFSPIVAEWSKNLLTPEQAEAIMRQDAWTSFEGVMDELDKVSREMS